MQSSPVAGPVAETRPPMERTVPGARLGIDFGTSHTVAVLARPDGRTEALLFESSPLLPSAVYLAGDDTMLIGRDAERSARIEPAAYEPHPKRRIDEGSVLLDGREVPVERLIEAILRRVATEACRILGGSPGATVLTHPAGWGPTRRALLTTAAAAAGLTGITLVSEPVAAAVYFTGVLGHRVPDGHAVVVYDFGGGTFDISVMRRTGDGWHVTAAAGLDDVGGIDLDAAVVDWVRGHVAAHAPQLWPSLWQQLERPATVADRRHRRVLWEDARSTKEVLSRATSAGMAVPLFDTDVYLTRPEFETLARPWLDRTVALTTATLFASDVTAGRLAGVFLVGGGSRVPLVATLLHQALGLPPVILEQPELVVAYGSLHVDASVTQAAAVTPPHTPAPAVAPLVTPAVVRPDVPAQTPPPGAGPVPGSPAAPVTATGAVAAGPAAHVPGPAGPQRLVSGGFLPALIALAVVAVVGVLSLLGDRSSDRLGPPLLAGLLNPLLPRSAVVVLAMLVAVVFGGTPGAPAAPAYRALGPALLAAGGGMLGLLLLFVAYEPGDDLSSKTLLWAVTVAAAAVMIGGLYLIARPAGTDPLGVPGSRRARIAWSGLWVSAGFLLVLAGTGRAQLSYESFDSDTVQDVQPLGGVLRNDGALTWWGTYLLGLTLMLGALLLLGATLRRAIVRNPAVHHDARRIGAVLLAQCGGLLLLDTVWDRTAHQLLAGVHGWYWDTFVRFGSGYGGSPTLWLALALTTTAAVAVPSLVSRRRSG